MDESLREGEGEREERGVEGWGREGGGGRKEKEHSTEGRIKGGGVRVGKMKRGGGITQPNLTRAIILFNLCVTGTFFLLEPTQDATLFLGFLLLFLHLLELFYLLFSCFFAAFTFTF